VFCGSFDFMAANGKKLSRRSTALLWLLGVSIVIGTLIYLEQIAILYVLATVSLVGLLLVVAFSNLENVGRENIEGFIGQKE
jgi:heme A synthase